MLLIDANIFLEVIFNQEHAQDCVSFLKQVREGTKEAVISTFTIDSIMLLMLRAKLTEQDLRVFLDSIRYYEGLQVFMPTIADRQEALNLLKRGLDYEDALTMQCGLTQGISTIVSYDKDFDALEGIVRSEPKEFL